MNNINFDILALKIIRFTREKGKGINYAIDMVPWYTNTEKEDAEVINRIKKAW